MDENILKEIDCHYRINDKIKFFCKIRYQNGSYFCLDLPLGINREYITDPFVCYDGSNKVYILQQLESPLNNQKNTCYAFHSLITIPTNIYNNKEIKFRSINFDFPYINIFFYILDYLKTETGTQEEIGLVYQKNLKFENFHINRKFSFDVNVGYQYGAGRIGGNGGHFDLIKSIKITSIKGEKNLNEFIDIIISLIDFFSICFRQKLLISNIWSNRDENSLNQEIRIQTSQVRIIDNNYNSEHITPFNILASYALLKSNFDKIIKRFLQSRTSEYDAFSILCDLYMQCHDLPTGILLQVKFLTFMQGIEAFVSKQKCNEDFHIDNKWKSAIKKFKRENPNLPNVKELKYSNQLSFKVKLLNVINEQNINQILNFKYDKKGNYKLISEMVDVRNYYTHYGDKKYLDQVQNFYDLVEYTKIFCEILIMKELKFTENQIKISLDNNYYYLRYWNNEYCNLDYKKLPVGYSKSTYLGESDYWLENKYFSAILFWKDIKDDNSKVKLIYKNQVQQDNDKTPRAKSIIVNKNLSKEEYNNLLKPFKDCYDRYKIAQEQIEYRNKKQTS